ncbi:MAG: hypothetical protein IPF41_14855 [Flavobacteriales bacterium]|nr:hypothetical protein [Flavobacteriales bacterium]
MLNFKRSDTTRPLPRRFYCLGTYTTCERTIQESPIWSLSSRRLFVYL